MKKFLFILLFFMSFKVSALEYTDYSSFSEYGEEVIEESDLVDVDVERRYKFYKFNKILGPYGDASLDFPLTDYDDYIYSDYSSFSDVRPLDKEGRVIDTFYEYYKLKDINYVNIYNNNSSLLVSDIDILYKGEKINYVMEGSSDGISFGFYDNVKFIFDEPIDVYYLTILVKLADDDVNSVPVWTVETGYNDVLYTANTLVSYDDKVFYGKDASVFDYSNHEVVYLDTDISDSQYIYQKLFNVKYKYKDKLYRTYKFEKEYYPLYLKDVYGDYIYKDDTDFKDFYAYRTRSVIPKKIVMVPDTLDVVTVKYNDKVKHETEVVLYYYLIPLGVLGILILVLSKLYKRFRNFDKV